jgi:hypothetical protein
VTNISVTIKVMDFSCLGLQYVGTYGVSLGDDEKDTIVRGLWVTKPWCFHASAFHYPLLRVVLNFTQYTPN